MIRLGFELLDGLDGYVLRVVEKNPLRVITKGLPKSVFILDIPARFASQL
jgi:hypothetical protein